MVTPLHLAEVKAANLRCHTDVCWRCEPGLNLLVGSNGSGKTTLLEAVCLMSHGRSFRQARDPHLTRRGTDGFAIEGHWRRYGPLHVRLQGSGGTLETRLQGRRIRQRRDLVQSIPVLVEAPQGRRLVDGAPNERRRWLNTLLTDCREGLVADFHRYGRSMMQRSRLLRRGVAASEVEAWEQLIVTHGLAIAEARGAMLEMLNAELAMETVLTESTIAVAVQAPVYGREMWERRLCEGRGEDRRTGRLDFGPHADRIHIVYQEREIRHSGSRGQQKLASVALKLAECAIRRHHRQMVPVLLLDDCLEALDPQRQERLLRRLGQFPGQVLMTAPVDVRIPVGLDVCVQRLDADGIRPAGQPGGISERTSKLKVGEAA
jgi:DNA replication and repair protein RecF